MSKLFDAMKVNETSTTHNGAKTLPNSGNDLVDLFSAIGSSRGKDLTGMFSRAFGGDPVSNVLATRILLWTRDVRGGAGERQTFRSLLPLLECYDQAITIAVIDKIPELGRWDDMFYFKESYAIDHACAVMAQALNDGNALCAKWMKRKGLHAALLRNYMGLSHKEYRRLIVDLTDVVETKMCEKDWGSINYEHIPSVASAKYGKAFWRNDEDRYSDYISKVEKGEAKVNAGAIFPYDVIRSMRNGGSRLANQQWKALPDYLEGSNENLMCVVDTSGSMGCSAGNDGSLTCMDVALSLGLYISERNKGIFENQFITFSSSPSLQTVSGNLSNRYDQMRRAKWSMSTDFQAVFKLILGAAWKHSIPQEEMPTKIVVLSDMEFNEAGSRTNFEAIDEMYADSGYLRPDIVFWNLNAREGNSPVKFDQNGTALVSGFSPALMKSILGGKKMTPFQMMMDVIMSDRYDLI